MRMTIQTRDGRQYAFSISDEQTAAQFVSGIRFWEIFDKPVLHIHDGRKTWSFNPALIEKIQFTDQEPPWRPPENVLSSKCVSAETYRRKLERLGSSPPAAGRFEEGKLIEAVFELTLASGAVEFFECYLMLRSPREQMVNMYRLFDKVAYPIPIEGGGFVLLNPGQISCIKLNPAPAEESNSAWVVDAAE